MILPTANVVFPCIHVQLYDNPSCRLILYHQSIVEVSAISDLGNMHLFESIKCFLHRDMKSDNILLSHGRHPLLKLADFGYSKQWALGCNSNMRTGAGTPGVAIEYDTIGDHARGDATDEMEKVICKRERLRIKSARCKPEGTCKTCKVGSLVVIFVCLSSQNIQMYEHPCSVNSMCLADS